MSIRIKLAFLCFLSYITFANASYSSGYTSLYKIGSITKTYTAFAIIKASEDGLINLNDPIVKFTDLYPRWNNITIKQLINQNSGIYDYTNSWYWWLLLYICPKKYWSIEDLLNISYKHELKTNNNWAYSNANYIILGYILEKIYNKPLETILNKVISSLDLHNTHYIIDDPTVEIKKQIVIGKGIFDINTKDINLSWIQSSGAIISNARDTAQWYLYYINYLIEHNLENEFLKIDQSTNYGFGVFVKKIKGHKIYYTTGIVPGYTSVAGYIIDKHISFSYMINKNISGANVFEPILISILAQYN